MTKTKLTRDELLAQLDELDRTETVSAQAAEIAALKAEVASMAAQRDKALASEKDALGVLREIDRLLVRYRTRLDETPSLSRQQRREQIMEEARAAQAAKQAATVKALGGNPGAKPMTPAGGVGNILSRRTLVPSTDYNTVVPPKSAI